MSLPSHRLPGEPPVENFDVIVLGAGPAGSLCALTTSEAGLKTALIDEQPQAGGQIWRAPWSPDHSNSQTPEGRDGSKIREALACSDVQRFMLRRIWSVTPGFRVDTVGPNGSEAFEAPRLVVALGAHERVVPFPGWTLPGVMGLAAATIMLKSHDIAPPEDWVLAGCGPLLAAVAAGYAAKGHPPKAIIDIASPWDWLKALPTLAGRPRLLQQGTGWVLTILTSRIPILFRHTVIKAEGEGQIRSCRIGPVDASGRSIEGEERELSCDALLIGHGLVPTGEVPRMLGARQVYRHDLGGWIADCDLYGRTSLEGLYAIGDGAGIRGGAVARLAGEMAGTAVAYQAGAVDQARFDQDSARLLAELNQIAGFSSSISRMISLKPGQVASIADETIICRCEDVSRRDLAKAAQAGATDVNQLKHFTRCGMGPCQGRMCGDVAAEILAQELGAAREAVGYWTQRPPLRPVSLAAMLGQFDYSDIPIPKPAPL